MSVWSYQPPPELSDEQYTLWQGLLEQRTGLCFLQHKSILATGLSVRMREIGCDDYETYFQQVSRVPEGAVEWSTLVDRVSINETSFFRQPEGFDAVRKHLLARLQGGQREEVSSLDLWSVGCATGEEAYSLAMAASDVAGYAAPSALISVFATDISHEALEVARSGRYNVRKLEAVAPVIKARYFKPCSDDVFEVRAELRDRVCFVQGNIIELGSMPHLVMDVIYCQNVLVYFRRERYQQVLNQLVERLKPGGLLVVGPGEASHWQHPELRRSADEWVQAYIKSEA